jgi:hypothetical protein
MHERHQRLADVEEWWPRQQLSFVTATWPATGDLNGDGTTDMMWSNPTNGAATTSLFTHLTPQDFLIV